MSVIRFLKNELVVFGLTGLLRNVFLPIFSPYTQGLRFLVWVVVSVQSRDTGTLINDLVIVHELLVDSMVIIRIFKTYSCTLGSCWSTRYFKISVSKFWSNFKIKQLNNCDIITSLNTQNDGPSSTGTP